MLFKFLFYSYKDKILKIKILCRLKFIIDTSSGREAITFNEICNEEEIKSSLILEKIEKEFKKEGFCLAKCKLPESADDYLLSKKEALCFEMEFSYYKKKSSTPFDLVQHLKREQAKYSKL